MLPHQTGLNATLAGFGGSTSKAGSPDYFRHKAAKLISALWQEQAQKVVQVGVHGWRYPGKLIPRSTDKVVKGFLGWLRLHIESVSGLSWQPWCGDLVV